ncbi:hypothetical protein KEM55_005115 [Ascosphaera atra]|nr:hypothetical protein KEM55_005115 [Ascosphaera atra]
MSYYYLSHKTIRHVLTHATPNPTFGEALGWMCAATEFDDLPVRHNEDLINAEIAKNMPLSVDAVGPGLPMWDPHVKAFLLLQAYFGRVELPISDYVGDQTSVLDQGIRIIQACIDLLAELGFPDACRMMTVVLRCVKVGRWPDDHPLSLLPGIHPREDTEEAKAQIPAKERQHDKIPSGFVELVSRGGGFISSIPKKLNFPARLASQFEKAVSMLPNLAISLHSLTSKELTVSIIRKDPLGQKRRVIASDDGQIRIYSPTFPKPQTEGWFLILTTRRRGKEELLAFKRVMWPSGAKAGNATGGRKGDGSISTMVTIKLPREFEEKVEEEESKMKESYDEIDDIKAAAKNVPGDKPSYKMLVQIVSDAYVGMEWSLQC